jgi:hypothetical protein
MNNFDNLPYFLNFWGYLNKLKKISWEAHGFHNCYWNVFDITIISGNNIRSALIENLDFWPTPLIYAIIVANMGPKPISLKVVPTQKMGEDHDKGKNSYEETW